MNKAPVNPAAVNPGCEPAAGVLAGTPAALGGRRLAQAAGLAGVGYAAISVYWAAGGTWLLDTVGSSLGQSGQGGHPGVLAAVWGAAALKLVAAALPLAATGVISWPAAAARRRQVRALAWAEAGILTAYGLVLSGAGWLEQAGAIATPAGADHRALAWHAFLWDPWFLLWGILVTAALLRSRRPAVRVR